jgi:hypothetical protein
VNDTKIIIFQHCFLSFYARLAEKRTKEKSKVYIPSTIKTEMNLVPFCFWADWAVGAVLKISAHKMSFVYQSKRTLFMVLRIYNFGKNIRPKSSGFSIMHRVWCNKKSNKKPCL